MFLNSKEHARFWRELERIEQLLRMGSSTAGNRFHDTAGWTGTQTFATFGNQFMAGITRVDRVRQALDESAPVARRLVMQQLSGIGLSDVWHILIAVCKEIALYYGGAVVAGAVVGGAVGAFAVGVGAAPGIVIGTAAGAKIGLWVLALLGLKELAEGLGNIFPAAVRHYERGFREAWGAAIADQRNTWSDTAPASGNVSAGAMYMAQGHVLMVTAILTALVAYLTRGRGNKALLIQEIRQSSRLGPKFAGWLLENERRLLAHPRLQGRQNTSAAMVVGEAIPTRGHDISVRSSSSSKVYAANANSAVKTASIDFMEGTGRLGGELYSPVKLKQLESYLSRRGIELKVGDAFVPFGKVGGFDATSGKLILRDNPTNYEVWHEISHFRQYQQLGREAYLRLPRSTAYNAPEQFVFDMLENSPKRWNALNFEEQQHAIRYIEYIGGFR